MDNKSEIMIRHRNGDESARSELIASLRPHLVACILGKVGVNDAAECLTDIVLERAFAEVDQWNPDRMSISCFVFHASREIVDPWESPAIDVVSHAEIAVHDRFVDAGRIWSKEEYERRRKAAIRVALSA